MSLERDCLQSCGTDPRDELVVCSWKEHIELFSHGFGSDSALFGI